MIIRVIPSLIIFLKNTMKIFRLGVYQHSLGTMKPNYQSVIARNGYCSLRLIALRISYRLARVYTSRILKINSLLGSKYVRLKPPKPRIQILLRLIHILLLFFKSWIRGQASFFCLICTLMQVIRIIPHMYTHASY